MEPQPQHLQSPHSRAHPFVVPAKAGTHVTRTSPSVHPEVEGHKTTNPNLTSYPNAATKTTPTPEKTPPSYNPCRPATPEITPNHPQNRPSQLRRKTNETKLISYDHAAIETTSSYGNSISSYGSGRTLANQPAQTTPPADRRQDHAPQSEQKQPCGHFRHSRAHPFVVPAKAGTHVTRTSPSVRPEPSEQAVHPTPSSPSFVLSAGNGLCFWPAKAGCTTHCRSRRTPRPQSPENGRKWAEMARIPRFFSPPKQPDTTMLTPRMPLATLNQLGPVPHSHRRNAL